MLFTQFLLFERTLPPLRSWTYGFEAEFTTSADRDVTISFQLASSLDYVSLWEIVYYVDTTTLRVKDVGDEYEILQGVMAYVTEFFRKNVHKDVVYFSGTEFRAGPYEDLAKKAIWKRSGAKELYVFTSKGKTSMSNMILAFYVYTDKGREFVLDNYKNVIKVK